MWETSLAPSFRLAQPCPLQPFGGGEVADTRSLPVSFKNKQTNIEGKIITIKAAVVAQMGKDS